jgi:TorA maturation chaperone TorD
VEVLRALGSLAEIPAASHAELCALLELGEPPTSSEYNDTFVFDLYPYSSVYLGHEGKLGGEARDRIAGFWRALGLEPPSEPDHLTVMLAFYAEICEHEAQAHAELEKDRWMHIRKSFLWEHLLSWLPIYLLKLAGATSPFYRNWGELLSQVLLEESRVLGDAAQLSSHLRSVSPVADPRDGSSQAFLESLLAPARSGLLLLRSDLTRAARDLSLAGRVGERRFLLETLLSQAPSKVLDWLAEYSWTTAQRYRGIKSVYPSTMVFWIDQADQTTVLLRDLAVNSQIAETET